jgi:hypothetical protein
MIRRAFTWELIHVTPNVNLGMHRPCNMTVVRVVRVGLRFYAPRGRHRLIRLQNTYGYPMLLLSCGLNVTSLRCLLAYSQCRSYWRPWLRASPSEKYTYFSFVFINAVRGLKTISNAKTYGAERWEESYSPLCGSDNEMAEEKAATRACRHQNGLKFLHDLTLGSQNHRI